MERIKRAASDWGVINENTVVGAQNLHPDLVLKNRKQILIIDATVPFDNGHAAIKEARNKKLIKYNQLAKELSTDGCTASVDAVVVGALGSWDP